jgi:hypothetical protein
MAFPSASFGLSFCVIIYSTYLDLYPVVNLATGNTSLVLVKLLFNSCYFSSAIVGFSLMLGLPMLKLVLEGDAERAKGACVELIFV